MFGAIPPLMPSLPSARRSLRQALDHPAFTPARRQKAEQLIRSSTDAAQLLRWKEAALKEGEAWEDAKLREEAAQPGPPAYPEYAY